MPIQAGAYLPYPDILGQRKRKLQPFAPLAGQEGKGWSLRLRLDAAGWKSGKPPTYEKKAPSPRTAPFGRI